MVSAQQIPHRNQARTRISFGFDATPKQKARQIGATRSQTFTCGCVDCNIAGYKKISTTFHEIKILYATSPKPEPPALGLKCCHDIAHLIAAYRSNAL